MRKLGVAAVDCTVVPAAMLTADADTLAVEPPSAMVPPPLKDVLLAAVLIDSVPVPAVAIVPTFPAPGPVMASAAPLPSIVMTELPVACKVELPPAWNVICGDFMATGPPPVIVSAIAVLNVRLVAACSVNVPGVALVLAMVPMPAIAKVDVLATLVALAPVVAEVSVPLLVNVPPLTWKVALPVVITLTPLSMIWFEPFVVLVMVPAVRLSVVAAFATELKNSTFWFTSGAMTMEPVAPVVIVADDPAVVVMLTGMLVRSPSLLVPI